MTQIKTWWMPSNFTLDTDNDQSWKTLLKYVFEIGDIEGNTAKEMFKDLHGNVMAELDLKCSDAIMKLSPNNPATNWEEIKSLLQKCLPEMAKKYFKGKKLQEVAENGIGFFNDCINGSNDDSDGILCGNMRMYLENGILPILSWHQSENLSVFDEELWTSDEIINAYRVYADMLKALKILHYPMHRQEEGKRVHIVSFEFYENGGFYVHILECITNGQSRTNIRNFLLKNAKNLFESIGENAITYFF